MDRQLSSKEWVSELGTDILDEIINDVFEYPDKETQWILNIQKQMLNVPKIVDNRGRTSEDKQGIYVCIADMLSSYYHFVSLRDSQIIYRYNFTNGIYLKDGESKIKELCYKIKPGYSNQARSEILEKIRIQNYDAFEIFDTMNVICLNNKVLNMDTYEVVPFDPKYKLTRKIPVTYNPKADPTEILNFLNDISRNDEKMVLGLLEIVGDCLNNHYHTQMMHMFVGKGKNGKGTFLRLLSAFLGKENISSLNLHEIEENFRIANLYNKLANICADLSTKIIEQTGKIKMATGEDLLEGNIKYKQEPVRFTNTAKMIFSCQEIPVSYDNTDGWIRRWNIFRFTKTYDGDTDDPMLMDKLLTENNLSALLNLAIEGNKRLKKQKHFSNDNFHNDFKMKALRYDLNSNSVKSFWEVCVKTGSNAYTKEEIYTVYVLFCELIGMNPKTKNHFFRTLNKLYDIIDHKPFKGQRIIMGIVIKNETEIIQWLDSHFKQIKKE